MAKVEETQVAPEPNDRRRAWLDQRRNSIGASESAAALGVHPYKSSVELWAEKCGLVEPDDLSGNEAVEFGLRLEPIIIEAFASRTGRDIRPWPQFESIRDPNRLHVSCTPDALEYGDDKVVAVVQIKTASAYLAKQWKDEPPLHYLVQVMQEMAVTSCKRATLVVLLGGQSLRYFDVQRDDRFIEAMVRKLDEFWAAVQSRIPPDVDWSESCTHALQKLHPDDNGETVDLPPEAIQWDRWLVRLKRHKRLIERLEAECQNRIKLAIGPNTFGRVPDSDTTYSWKTYDRQERVQKAGTYRMLLRSEPKRAKSRRRLKSHAPAIEGPKPARKKPAEVRARLLEMHPRCRWCGRTLTTRTATIEHLVPKAHGGTNRFENLSLACRPCNQKRGDTGLDPADVED